MLPSFRVLNRHAVLRSRLSPIAFAAIVLQPDGALVLTTMNRSPAAFWLAVVGAEYVSRLVPAGTHEWAKFVTPDELRGALADRGIVTAELLGLSFNPLTGRWAEARGGVGSGGLAGTLAVNYALVGRKVPTRP